MFASSELRCLPLGRKLGVTITCGDCYPPIGCRTKKKRQLPRNELGLQWVIECILTSYGSATRVRLVTDLVILSHGQMTRTKPGLAAPSPKFPTTQTG
ncbi:hypothetical protein TNCV_4347051 [Trichonephila clavipes]|nr:hypothetical protein TNCV_4347051 [Trichonephila clavipes]